MQSIHSKIVRRIDGSGRGSVYYSGDFVDIGETSAVKQSLYRLTLEQKLCRLSPGIYYFPEKSKLLKTELTPRIDKVAEAVARKNKMRILITEPLAANLLGLSTQVPAKYVFLTDGRSRKVAIGNQQIIFKHAAPSIMGLSKRKAGIVIQALRYFGAERVNKKIIEQLQRTLPRKVKNDLVKCVSYAPAWMHKFLREIACEE